MKDLLIKNAQIVNAHETLIADILIQGAIISRIEKGIRGSGEEIIVEAGGMPVIPGGIDPHVHLALPSAVGMSSDDFSSGSRAALAGGTTSLIDFVTPGKEELLTTALSKRKKEAENCVTDVGFHMGITSWRSHTAEEMRRCVEEEGITSFKVYLAYIDTIGVDYQELELIMETAAKLGALVAVHCEDGKAIAVNQENLRISGRLTPAYHAVSRPDELEARAVQKLIELSEKTACRVYIVHVSCRKSVELISSAQKRGVEVEGETCLHYLLFDESVYQLPDYEMLPYIVSPPIRSKSDQDALWTGISDGTLKVVSTDHCPFKLKGQKDTGIKDFTKIPNGTGGIGFRLSLLYTYGVLTKRITMNQWVDLCSAQAARIFGMSAAKGCIAEGFNSDLVLWDPEVKRIIHADELKLRCDHTIYEGFQILGGPKTIIRQGRICG